MSYFILVTDSDSDIDIDIVTNSDIDIVTDSGIDSDSDSDIGEKLFNNFLSRARPHRWNRCLQQSGNMK